MGQVNCLVTDLLQNIFLCVYLLIKENQRKSHRSFLLCTACKQVKSPLFI